MAAVDRTRDTVVVSCVRVFGFATSPLSSLEDVALSTYTRHLLLLLVVVLVAGRIAVRRCTADGTSSYTQSDSAGDSTGTVQMPIGCTSEPPEECGPRPTSNYSVVSCAKTAEPIEMPFGLWARMGPRNHVLDGSPRLLRDVAMANIFFLSIYGVHIGAT